jgi:orotate phosphoribosyltransferase
VTDREVLRSLLLDRSFIRGDFILASGQRSAYYIDARKTTMSAEGLAAIGRLGLAALKSMSWTPRAVGGLTMGADPVAYAIARASLDHPPIIDAFSVRKTPKDHGTGQLIEGNFVAGAAVVIVEDVLTSGGSAERAITAVEQAGGHVLGVLVVVDREQGGRDRLEQLGKNVVAITTISDLGLNA